MRSRLFGGGGDLEGGGSTLPGANLGISRRCRSSATRSACPPPPLDRQALGATHLKMLLLLIWRNLLVLLEVLLLLPGRSVSVLGSVELCRLLWRSVAATHVLPVYGYIDTGTAGWDIITGGGGGIALRLIGRHHSGLHGWFAGQEKTVTVIAIVSVSVPLVPLA